MSSLNQIYVVPVLPPGYNYDNLHAPVMDELTPSTSAGATASVLLNYEYNPTA